MTCGRCTPFMRSVIIPVTLVAFMSGCTRWAVVFGPAPSAPTAEAVEELLAARNPEKVRVSRSDGTTVEITGPRVENDSILRAAIPRTGVPVDDILTIEAREIDGGTTGIIVGVSILMVLGGLAMASLSDQGFK